MEKSEDYGTFPSRGNWTEDKVSVSVTAKHSRPVFMVHGVFLLVYFFIAGLGEGHVACIF